MGGKRERLEEGRGKQRSRGKGNGGDEECDVGNKDNKDEKKGAGGNCREKEKKGFAELDNGRMEISEKVLHNIFP